MQKLYFISVLYSKSHRLISNAYYDKYLKRPNEGFCIIYNYEDIDKFFNSFTFIKNKNIIYKKFGVKGV